MLFHCQLVEGGRFMYTADVIWWGYTIYVILLALFMLFFARKIRQKGD
jgi:hypothetical protein